MTLNRKLLVSALSAFMAIIVIFHIIGCIVYYTSEDYTQYVFIDIFDLGYEENVPAIFSSLLFFINSTLLLFLWHRHKQLKNADHWYWLGLSVLFLFLGFDEGARLHEKLGDKVEPYVDATGYFYFPWFIPYMIVFAFLVALYFRFYLRLERSLQIRFFVAAFVYLTGAVGVEVISANEASENDTTTVTYVVLYSIEEILEMSGLIFFIDTLFRQAQQYEVTIKFE